MSRGKGGKIKNWKKADGKLFWRNDKRNIATVIGRKTRKGYPVKVFGEGIESRITYKRTKEDARNYATKLRRRLK